MLDRGLLVGVLSLDTPWSSTTEWTVQGKVNVLLAVYSHNEGWHIHNLLANPEPQHRQSAADMMRLCTNLVSRTRKELYCMSARPLLA